ncbi:MAG: hypothetical protein IJ573_07385, partial [Clostridia bacterium]|nr:hypothetical protein [Clostridia bacterium]
PEPTATPGPEVFSVAADETTSGSTARIDPAAGLSREDLKALLNPAVTGAADSSAEATPSDADSASVWPDVNAEADAAVLWLADKAETLPEGALDKLLGVVSGESLSEDGSAAAAGEGKVTQAAALLGDDGVSAIALAPDTKADSQVLSSVRDLLNTAKDAAEASPFNLSDDDGFTAEDDVLSFHADGIASASLRRTPEGDWLTVGEGDVPALLEGLEGLTKKLSATPTPEPTVTPEPTPEATDTPEPTEAPTTEPTEAPTAAPAPTEAPADTVRGPMLLIPLILILLIILVIILLIRRSRKEKQ